MIRHKELRCCLENSTSAIVLALREGGLEARTVESARFDRARSEARTSCGGLLDGQIFDRIADNAEHECKKDRKAGPPDDTEN